MNFGVSVNNRGATYLQEYQAPDMLRLARRCEELDFSYLWVHDNILGNSGYEVISTLSAISAVTTKIKVGTSILIPYYRNIILLSEQLATIDRISSGRLIVGLGTGGLIKDTFNERKEFLHGSLNPQEVLIEMITAIKELWNSNGPSTFEGKYFQFKDVSISYKPIQQPSPPVWIASGTYRNGRYSGNFDLVSKIADGWFTLRVTPEEFEQAVSKIVDIRKRYCVTSALAKCVEFWFALDSNLERAETTCKDAISRYLSKEVQDDVVARWSLFGTADHIIESIQRFQDAGMNSIKIISASNNQIESVEAFASEVVPSF